MIDIHNHILPGIDDGAQDNNESIAILQMAQAKPTSQNVKSINSI